MYCVDHFIFKYLLWKTLYVKFSTFFRLCIDPKHFFLNRQKGREQSDLCAIYHCCCTSKLSPSNLILHFSFILSSHLSELWNKILIIKNISSSFILETEGQLICILQRNSFTFMQSLGWVSTREYLTCWKTEHSALARFIN